MTPIDPAVLGRASLAAATADVAAVSVLLSVGAVEGAEAGAPTGSVRGRQPRWATVSCQTSVVKLTAAAPYSESQAGLTSACATIMLLSFAAGWRARALTVAASSLTCSARGVSSASRQSTN